MAGNLEKLIHSATNSPNMLIEEPQLKAIKSLVRTSDDNVKASVEFLMNRLGKNHSHVRYLSLLIIDELFMRSKLFRSLLVGVFESFLLLSVGYRAEQPLPPPADRAAQLKAKALEFIERWNDKFGPNYKQLRLGYEYLKDTLGLKFPGIQEAATRAQEERRARERRTHELLRCRLSQLSENFPGLKKDVVSTLDQMEECFAILSEARGDEGENEAFFPDEDDEGEVYGIQRLRLAREHEGDEELAPEESRDNAVVFDMLRDLVKLVSTRHLPATHEWLSVLMRVDPEERGPRDSLMKEVIDLRNRLQALKSKCEGFGVELVHKLSRADSIEDDIEWEDEQAVAVGESSSQKASGGSDPEAQQQTEETPSLTGKDSAGTSELKKKLMREAPVLEWGSFLTGWGSDTAVHANSRGLSVDNHWGRVDPDVVIPSEKLATMQMRASYYQPLKSDIRPCLAPLRNGGLCQRRDLRRCPLHGPVIPRDDQGNPVEQKKEGESKSTAVFTPEQVAAQAIRNVRNKDDVDRRSKKLARQSQAKIDRQHNETVLRSAAVTLETLSEEAPGGGAGESSRKRKGGLAAMLHKKQTPKDRIAKKLLTGRAAEATMTTLARAEDATYRESFPNQW